MFDIGWGELVVIGVVALIAIGPKELPAVLRATGQWMGKIRRMANEFQDQFRDAMREAELDDLKKKVDDEVDDFKKKVDDLTSTPDDFGNFDPLGSVRKDVESAVGDAPALDSKPPEPSSTESNSTETPSAPQLVSEPAPQPASEPAPQDARKAGEGA